MKIYDYEGFPNPARVRMAIAEKNLGDKVEFVHVDVPAGEHKKPEFLAKNPSGAVPVLELSDGTIVTECTAITEYLDHLSGEPELTGRTGKERAVTHMMQRRAEARLMDAVADYFHFATPGLGPDIESYQNDDWGKRRRDQAIDGMRYFDAVLANQDFVAGDRFSMADITVIAGLGFADFAEVEIPAECTHLKAWRERVTSRPALAA